MYILGIIAYGRVEFMVATVHPILAPAKGLRGTLQAPSSVCHP